MDPVDKPDPYGEWVLFGIKDRPDGPPLPVDEDLLAGARNAWPRVLAHVRAELFDRELGPERTALAAEVWDRVLRSVAKTRLRNTNRRPPISDLESYLIGVFHHRFNRLLRQEQRRTETIELVASVADLERFEAALDTRWAEQLERDIAARQITSRMNPWTKKVWLARQYKYSWKTDCGLAWRHRAAGKNEVLLQFGKDSAVYSSRGETQNTEETGLNPAGCIFASGKIELRRGSRF